MPPELLQQLSELGIDPNSLPEPDAVIEPIINVGVPFEYKEEVAAWIESGGIPEFEKAA